MWLELQTILVELFSWEYLFLGLYILFLLLILTSDKTPESILAWIFTITIFPLIGFVVYLLLGVNWRKNRLRSLQQGRKSGSFFSKNLLEYDPSEFFRYEDLEEESIATKLEADDFSDSEREIIKLLHNTEGSSLTKNSSYEMFYEGKEAFTSILQDIQNAKESIYMEYFIWRSDGLGERIKDVLIEKAKEGVQVKLLFDGMGSIGTISRKYRKELQAAGVEFRYFLDVALSLPKLNYRNHRKMTIVDTKILHTGGMNLGEEYITGGKYFDSWRDTNVRIEGELVNYYLAIFLADWLNSGGKEEFDNESIGEIIRSNKVKRDNVSYMQVSSSGPDTVWTSLKYLYSKLILESKEEVLIQSPYFVPDAALIEQLKIAALSGVKIKLMMTGIPDQKIPFWIAEAYFEELLHAGVQIYRYQKGFLHCKTICSDRKISTLGTCNFDMRSFDINYEVNTVFYGKKTGGEMAKQFYIDLEDCIEIKKENLKQQSFFRKLRNSIFKIISPIM